MEMAARRDSSAKRKAQREVRLKIYRDTNTLPHNIMRCTDQNSQNELEALKQLDGRFEMFASHIVHYELMNTPGEIQRDNLAADFKAFQALPADEKLLYSRTQTDPYGGFVTCGIISDVQDETVREELMKRGLEQRDAEHLAQAVYNYCDVFLTLDGNSIIRPHGEWLEKRFPKLRVCRPSQLLAFVQAATTSRSEIG
jgi:hypothetical protein